MEQIGRGALKHCLRQIDALIRFFREESYFDTPETRAILLRCLQETRNQWATEGWRTLMGLEVNISAMNITNKLVKQYHQAGYLVCRDLITPDEVRDLREAYTSSLEKMRRENKLKSIRSGTDLEGRETAVYQIRMAHLHHPLFNDLIHDARLLNIVESLIGPNIRIVLFQGLYKPPLTGGTVHWHQDDYYFRVDKENAVVSCWLTLDDATVDNGCMWVLPGAHRQILEHIPLEGGGLKMLEIDEAKAVPIELKAGQCMFHHGSMPHRTLDNTTNSHRRALAIHFMDATAKPMGKGRQQEPLENMPIV